MEFETLRMQIADFQVLAGKLFYQEGGRKLQNALISVDQAWYISCTFS